MNINDTLRSGGVERWHQNPDLPPEPLAAHQWRVAMLARWMCPTITLNGVLYALTHDVGELVVGDVSAETKAKDEKWVKLHSGAEFEAMEDIVGGLACSRHEYKIIRLADKLDAYWYMLQHNRGLRHLPEWRASYKNILEMESRAGVSPLVGDLIGGWRQRADVMDGLVK